MRKRVSKNSALSTQHSALKLMLVVLGVYLLTMSGHTYSPDEETMLESSWSLVESGRWDIHPGDGWMHTEGTNGRYYSVFGAGQQVAAVPWVAAGLMLGDLFPQSESGFVLRLVLGSYNALVTAGLVALLAATGMALGYSERASLLLGGALAFATFLWPHSRTLFAEPMVGLLFLGSFYLLLRNAEWVMRNVGRQAILALSGALFALALLFKVQYAVALPAFLVYLFLKTAQDRRQATNALTTAVRSAFRIPHSAIAWLLGFATGLIPLLAYNWAAFGSPFRTGYGADFASLFRTPVWEGAFGLLLSPGKGLLWYAPPVILSLYGARHFVRRHKAEGVFMGILAAILVAFFGMFHLWWGGGGAWGPRFLAPLLPFVLMPALPVVQRAVGGRRAMGDESYAVRSKQYATVERPSSIVHRLTVAIVIAIGIVLNLPGALLNFDTYVNSGVDDERRNWEPADSPLAGHVRMLGRLLRPNDGLVTLFTPAGTVFLKRGFSYSEGNKERGELLPRWTTGNGGMEIRPDLSRGPVTVTLRLVDHRPPELPRAPVTILVDDKPTGVITASVENSSISADYSFQLTASPARVEVRSPTWNPSLSGASSRNEDLGVKLERIMIFEGGALRDYRLVEDLPPPAYYPTPRWYYDPQARHPADLWFVYMARTGMGRRAMLALGVPIVLVGLGCIGAGLLLRRRVKRDDLAARGRDKIEIL